MPSSRVLRSTDNRQAPGKELTYDCTIEHRNSLSASITRYSKRITHHQQAGGGVEASILRVRFKADVIVGL